MIALALLVATAMSPQSAQDIRCVAVLGIVASDQRRAPKTWVGLPPLGSDGARFAAVVGARTMAETGQTREAVRDLILADVAKLQKSKTIPRGDVEACVTRMTIVAPPPTLPRCAAVTALAADAAREGQGVSESAKDLATLAAVLAYRARVEGAATGQSASQVADQIAVEREAAHARGGIQDDLVQDCAALAAPK